MQTPRNIYIIGAQSTGKTTLVHALQRHFASPRNRSTGVRRPAVINEVARKVISELQIDRDEMSNSPTRCFELQKTILNAQYSAESPLWTDHSGWYLSDRSGLDPIVYARLYAGKHFAESMLRSSVWRAIESKMREGLVVVCESGCSWFEDDGVRLMPQDMEEWDRTHETFLMLLRRLHIDFVVVPKDLIDINDRVELVVQAHKAKAIKASL